MTGQIREYHRPTDWKHAQEVLARTDMLAVPLFLSPRSLAPDEWPANAVVDLSRLGLDYILSEDGYIKIGALATLQSLVESPLLKTVCAGILNLSAEYTGTLGLRNFASLGGLLGDPAAPQELVLTLLALDAAVMVRTLPGEVRAVSLADFISGKHAMNRGDLPVEVAFAIPSGAAALERVARTPRDQAIVAAVAYFEIKDDQAAVVRVAVCGASPLSQRVEPVENWLAGKPLTPDALEAAASLAQDWAAPIGDLRAAADYRKAVTGIIVRRAVQSAWRQAA